jgi:3-deoxy-D-manno-octulosonic-acid transferase
MKFDDYDAGEMRAFGQIFKNDYGPVLVAGSTHAGEEEIVLNVFKRLRERFGGLSLVLAPRHVERAQEVEECVIQAGLHCTRFSRVLDGQKLGGEIILVDSIGHLRDLYAYASVVFIGKSLIGRGGQNIIEPAVFGKPIIVGPYTENFRSTIDVFKNDDAVIVVEDQANLYSAIEDLLNHPNRAVEIGRKAQEVIKKQHGAVNRTLEQIKKVISSEPLPA